MDLTAGFRLGQYDVRPEENVIIGPAGEARVEPKGMDVLVQLAAAGGRTVSRDQIVNAVWPRGFVSDDVLTRCVAQVRKALGDNPKAPEYLVTIRKRGYKLVKPISPLESTRLEDLASAPGVLVLPLQNLSKDPADLVVADGLTELITASLAGTGNLRVISRTTATALGETGDSLPQIARRAGAEWVVEGSVMIVAEQVQVVIQLIDAIHDIHVFAETHSRTMDALLELQNEIAQKVADSVSTALGVDISSPAKPVENLPEETLRLYLRGRCFQSQRTADDLREALSCFRKVTEMSKDFSDAYASMAESTMMLAHYGDIPVNEACPQIRQFLKQSLSLDPENAMSLYCRGATRLFFDRDLQGAESDLKRALSLQPSNSMASLSMANISAVRREFDDALAWLDQALLVNPLDVGLNMNLGDHLILQNRHSDAASQFRKTLALDESHLPTRLRLAWALALDGRSTEARKELARVSKLTGSTPMFCEYAAMVHAGTDDSSGARSHYEALRQLQALRFVAPWSLARAAAAASEVDDAVTHLETALKHGSSSLIFFHLTPAFEALRALPQGRKLVKQIGATV